MRSELLSALLVPFPELAREAVLLAEIEPQRWEPRATFPFREP